jgi:hypothetical protein
MHACQTFKFTEAAHQAQAPTRGVKQLLIDTIRIDALETNSAARLSL